MASRYFEARALLLAALSLACGREDVELSPSPGNESDGGAGAASTPEPGDCSARVPADLLAARPPLGWNGYNAFGCAAELDEAKVKANAQAMIDSQMLAAGYRYVNLDRCWQQPARDAAGHRQFDPTRLPSGIESLSDWVHERGLSLGIRVTNADCQSEPATEDHETEDVESFEKWKLDYIKYVACVPTTQVSVERLAKALDGASRPVVLSLTAAPFVEWMLLGVIALRHEGKLEYDPDKMRITNNAEANKLLKPTFRKGWEFHTVKS